MTRNDRRPNARRFASPKFVREGNRAYTSFFTGKPHVAGGCPQDMLALNDTSDNRGELRVYVDASASWRVLGHAFLMRNYRASLGKWQTADPMGYPDGWNQLAYGVNLTKIADALLQKLGIDITGLTSPTYSFEVKSGEYQVKIPCCTCAAEHHNGTGYEIGVIVAHPIFMREYTINEEGKKEYLNEKIKYGVFIDFLKLEDKLCE